MAIIETKVYDHSKMSDMQTGMYLLKIKVDTELFDYDVLGMLIETETKKYPGRSRSPIIKSKRWNISMFEPIDVDRDIMYTKLEDFQRLTILEYCYIKPIEYVSNVL